jgi:transposase InsO family protein
MERDAKYSDAFRNILTREGFEVIRLPPRSPNLNAYAARFVRSVKAECLNRMIFFGKSSLQRALTHYMAHSVSGCCKAPARSQTGAAQSNGASDSEVCLISIIVPPLNRRTSRSGISGQ